MDRRLLPLTVCALLACGEQRAPRRASGGDAAPTAAPTAPPAAAPVAPDAEVEEPAPPIKASDVLSGPAAEQVIADSVTPREAPPADAAELGIRSDGVGALELGMSRREVATRLPKIGRYLFRKVWTPPAEAGLEIAEVLGPSGAPLLRLRIYGARLTRIEVLARDARARTAADVQVGSTFDDALLGHGDARRHDRGWVLSDLPGVIFVPELPGAPPSAPPPAARIGTIVVVGPEAD